MDGRFFLVESDSPLMTVIGKHEQKWKAFSAAVEEFRIRHGADGAFTYGRHGFAGLQFKGDAPEGWRKRQDGMAVPNTRCKAGRALKKEIDALPHGFDAWTFSDELGEGYTHWWDGKIYFSTVGQYGDKYVLRVPAPCQVKPDGCTELKTSEYWQIREAAGLSGPEEAEAA